MFTGPFPVSDGSPGTILVVAPKSTKIPLARAKFSRSVREGLFYCAGEKVPSCDHSEHEP